MSRTLERRLERVENTAQRTASVKWTPLPGPQTVAYESTADVIGYGGAAGGGKTDLAIGKALTQHQRVAFFRRHTTEMHALIDRVAELLGTREGLNANIGIWRLGERQLEFGSAPSLGDERKYQGRPKDLLVLDEAANFLEAQVRFLMGWVRSTDPDQKCQTLMCFNPPTSAEGRWIVDFFGPWLDRKHSNPAQPGELRYFAMVAGKEIEVPDGTPFEHDGERITPLSRTFIPARVSDNPYLAATGYMATLQALPEPLRSQMLHGDFNAGMEDDPWQVIPTAWVELAMRRWTKPHRLPRMMSVGVDVARGGRDKTIIARRHEGWWFDEILEYPGSQTPDGPTVAGLTIAAVRDRAPIHIDVIGVGASPYDFLKQARQQVIGVNVAEAALGTDKSGRLSFSNQRSQLWWRIRELLDPTSNTGIALPPDRRLLVDLCAPKWHPRGAVVYVESRDEIVARIGRSPDFASALILAAIETPRIDDIRQIVNPRQRDYDPFELMKGEGEYSPSWHDPFEALS
jgi:hypothetical protein